MVGELVMLPVRVGLRATRLWLRAAEETVSATGRLMALVASRGSGRAVPETPATRPPSNGGVEAFTAPEPAPAHRAQPTPAPDAGAAEPAHVSEEPTLVEELAEAGAEDGAGAEVRVDPPWEDYGRMNAREIVARLSGADAAELAAVELYEATTRRRQTILNAAERELRRVNGSSSPSNQRG